jgi:hypothetical protein
MCITYYRSHTALVCMAQCVLLAPDKMSAVAPQLVSYPGYIGHNSSSLIDNMTLQTERVSHLPASPRIAIAVLELLCSLLDCPPALVSLQCKHYVHVCRTLCMYVNAHKYTLFIVAHALHILMRWVSSVPSQWQAPVADNILQAIHANAHLDTATADELQLHSDVVLVLREYLARHALRVPSGVHVPCDTTTLPLTTTNVRYWLHGNSLLAVYTTPIHVPAACRRMSVDDDESSVAVRLVLME